MTSAWLYWSSSRTDIAISGLAVAELEREFVVVDRGGLIGPAIRPGAAPDHARGRRPMEHSDKQAAVCCWNESSPASYAESGWKESHNLQEVAEVWMEGANALLWLA